VMPVARIDENRILSTVSLEETLEVLSG